MNIRPFTAQLTKRKQSRERNERRRLLVDDSFQMVYPVLMSGPGFGDNLDQVSGTQVFSTSGPYGAINSARVQHLQSLNIPLEGKRVADVGAGIGDLGQFFVEKGCSVVCFDGREENIQALKAKYPGQEAYVLDVERDSLRAWGSFDIVFAYGLLYHLENPIAALRNMGEACTGFALIETMICDHSLPILRVVKESRAFDQALKGLGSRPSPSYIALALQEAGFESVYAAKHPPRHLDYRFELKGDLALDRGGMELRAVFVGSKIEINEEALLRLSAHPRNK